MTLSGLPDHLKGVLAGRYSVEREVGRGGMAAVYLARDLRHDTQVAIKVLDPELAARIGPERFAREIRITAGLHHPNILSAFDSGEVGGLPFCVMPFVVGETLEERLARTGPLPVEEAVHIAIELADGLAYVHQRGLIHRDVKPSNVFLVHGHALLADFGIARAMDAAGPEVLTSTGLAVGTPSYMSPEQAGGDPLDGRSDLYSLGCVLYEMLAGSPPFTGSSARVVLARHLSDPLPPLRTVRDTVPLDLERAILRATAKLPADRFPNADGFKKALQGAGTGDGLPVTRASRPPSKRRLRVLTTVGALILAAGLLAELGRHGLSGPGNLDLGRIMVFPLVVSDGFPGSRSVGEDVATLIGNALDGAGPLRWIDAWAHLEPAVRDNIRTLSPSAARSLALRERCGYSLTGNVLALGDSADVSLVLSDIRGDSVLMRVSATAPLDQAWKGFAAVNELLPRLIPGGEQEVSEEWVNRPPSAILNFLLGERDFRRVQLEDALDHYRLAVEADSTFAMAAMRGAQAASWNHLNEEAAGFIETAARQPLPPRYAAFARGYLAYLDGKADAALSALREAVALDPELGVAWLQIGETWTHLLPSTGTPDDSALVAFREAARLDPTATNTLFHSIEILVRRGEREEVEPLVARFLAAGPEERYAQQVGILFDCLRLGPQGVDWDELARTQPFPLLAAAAQLGGWGAQAACAVNGYEALLRNDTTSTLEADSRRFWEIFGLQNLLLARGQEEDALEQVDAFVDRWGVGTSLYLLDAPLYPVFMERAREIASRDAALHGANYRGLTYPYRLWELGSVEVKAGRLEVARQVMTELASRGREPGSTYEAILSNSLRARLALAEGDTAAALPILESLVPTAAPGDTLRYSEGWPMGAERLELARILNVQGEHRRAIQIADVLDSPWPSIHNLYLRPGLELRAAAAAALGDAGLERRYRRRLDALASPDVRRPQDSTHQ